MSPEQFESLLKAMRDDGIASHFWILMALVIFAMVGAFVGAYLQHKGENLATREDAASLTRLVEEVRTQQAVTLEAVAQSNRVALHRLEVSQGLRMAALDRRLQVLQEAYS